MSSLPLSHGPILVGGAIALMLSGVVAVQCIIFFRLYHDESRIKTALVALVWALDMSQSFLLLTSLVFYFITHFGDPSVLASIPWSIALTILVTAVQTSLVHLFYAAKIYRSSGKNWWITGPILSVAGLRLLTAVGATVEMLREREWIVFIDPQQTPHFLFTTGLSLSVGADVIITLFLCHYLRKIRKLSSSSVMKGVLDTLTLYTLENGLITCLTTIGVLTFWVVMPTTALSLGLHFVLGKLYPNSLLVLLNTRKELREMHSGDPGVHFQFDHPSDHHLASYYTHFPHRAPITHCINRTSPTTPSPIYGYRPRFKMHMPMEVEVKKTVERDSLEISSVSDFEQARPPRSLGTSLNWRALP